MHFEIQKRHRGAKNDTAGAKQAPRSLEGDTICRWISFFAFVIYILGATNRIGSVKQARKGLQGGTIRRSGGVKQHPEASKELLLTEIRGANVKQARRGLQGARICRSGGVKQAPKGLEGAPLD